MGETKKQVRVVNQRPSRVVISRQVRQKIKNEYGQEVDVLKEIDELVLEPGANIVDAARIDQFSEPELPCVKLFDEGVLVVQELPEPKEKNLQKAGGDLAKVEEAEALKAVQGMKDPKQLERSLMQDGRPKVRTALHKRADELKKSDGSEDRND